MGSAPAIQCSAPKGALPLLKDARRRVKAADLKARVNSEKEEFKPTREQLAQIKWQIIEAEKEEQAAADALKMAQQELQSAKADEDKANKKADEQLNA